MTCAQEPRFIPNPNGTSEEDGLLLTIAYNFDKQVTSLIVLDPKTMDSLQEYQLPFRLSMGFHSNYWPYASLDPNYLDNAPARVISYQ